MATQRKSPMDHPAVVTFLILAVIAAMSLAAEVLKPLALAVLLSFALAPLAGFFERRRVPRAAAVILTVALALGSLSGIGYVVVRQLSTLAYELPNYQKEIQKKVNFLKPSDDTAIRRAQKVAGDVAKSLDTPVVAGHEAMDVRVVEEPTFRQRLQAAVGPYLEFIGVGSFVLILVLFMLMNREELGDRIVQLFGQRQINLTTRTMGEIGQRISRYLAMITLVNSGFGLIVGLGLWAIGVPYAVLWGCLAAMMRFIPYVGAAVAFASAAGLLGRALPRLAAAAGSGRILRGGRGGAELSGAGHLRQDHRGVGPGPPGRGDVLDVALGAAGHPAVDAHDGLPGGSRQVRSEPGLFRDAPGRGGRAGPEHAVLPAARLARPGRGHRGRRSRPEGTPACRGLRSDPGPGPLACRARRGAGELEESDMAFIRRVIGEILDDLEGTEEISLKTPARSGEGEPGEPMGHRRRRRSRSRAWRRAAPPMP